MDQQVVACYNVGHLVYRLARGRGFSHILTDEEKLYLGFYLLHIAR